MKIFKKDNKIIIEIPFWSKRSNPYMPREYVGKHHTLVGLIYIEEGEEKMGFAKVIDMDYAGKPDQNTDIMYYWYEDKGDFIKKCEELGIQVIEYPICAYCGNSIWGSYIIGDKGNMCYKCQSKEEEK